MSKYSCLAIMYILSAARGPKAVELPSRYMPVDRLRHPCLTEHLRRDIPPIAADEALEATKIYSVAGLHANLRVATPREPGAGHET